MQGGVELPRQDVLAQARQRPVGDIRQSLSAVGRSTWRSRMASVATASVRVWDWIDSEATTITASRASVAMTGAASP